MSKTWPDLRPVEADTRGAFLQLLGAGQRRQAEGDTVEHAGLAALGFRLLGALLGLGIFPGPALRFGGTDRFIAEDVGMAADHLVGDGLGHGLEIEVAGFLGHAGMEDDLQQQVAQLLLEAGHVVLGDGVGDLVGFLDGVGRDGREGLLDVPGAAIWPDRAAWPSPRSIKLSGAARPCLGSASRS